MNTYLQHMPAMFPWVIPCSEPEANKLIRILMRNDKRCRPTPLANGSSFAYTVNFENGLGGDLWLSSTSADRIVLLNFDDVSVKAQDTISALRLRMQRSSQSHYTVE